MTDWDLSKDNIRSIKNKHLGEILGVFGLKNLVQSENADRDCTYTYMKTLNNLLRKILDEYEQTGNTHALQNSRTSTYWR